MARKLQKNKWIKFPGDDDIKFLIRPFSVLFLKTLPSDLDTITPEMMWEIFNGAVLDWKGFNDPEGNDLICNERNKRMVAEEFNDILTFVFTESINSQQDVIKEKEIKN